MWLVQVRAGLARQSDAGARLPDRSEWFRGIPICLLGDCRGAVTEGGKLTACHCSSLGGPCGGSGFIHVAVRVCNQHCQHGRL